MLPGPSRGFTFQCTCEHFGEGFLNDGGHEIAIFLIKTFEHRISGAEAVACKSKLSVYLEKIIVWRNGVYGSYNLCEVAHCGLP